AACDAVFARALAKRPDERYSDATTFVAALMGADAGTGMPGISPDPLLKSLVSSMSPSAASAAAGGAHRATPAPRTMAATGPAAASPLVRPLAPGNHHLKVFEPGYAPAELSLQLSPGTTAAPLRFVMAPLPAAVPAPARAEPEKATGGRGGAKTREAPRADASRSAPTLPAATRAWTREGELVGLTAADRPPRRISGETPRYPDEARHLRMSGSVLVEMIVTERGEPEQVRVLESAGAVLDATVTGAISSWRFEPALRHGVKVRVRWQYRHTFSPR